MPTNDLPTTCPELIVEVRARKDAIVETEGDLIAEMNNWVNPGQTPHSLQDRLDALLDPGCVCNNKNRCINEFEEKISEINGYLNSQTPCGDFVEAAHSIEVFLGAMDCGLMSPTDVNNARNTLWEGLQALMSLSSNVAEWYADQKTLVDAMLADTACRCSD
jgi:hypothetical protein